MKQKDYMIELEVKEGCEECIQPFDLEKTFQELNKFKQQGVKEVYLVDEWASEVVFTNITKEDLHKKLEEIEKISLDNQLQDAAGEEIEVD